MNSKGNLVTRLIGIDNNYTRGDKALAWSAFIYSFGWCFCLCVVANVVWHVLGAKGNPRCKAGKAPEKGRSPSASGSL